MINKNDVTCPDDLIDSVSLGYEIKGQIKQLEKLKTQYCSKTLLEYYQSYSSKKHETFIELQSGLCDRIIYLQQILEWKKS